MCGYQSANVGPPHWTAHARLTFTSHRPRTTTTFMRGRRRFVFALLMAAVSLPLMASPAQADYADRDPDDTDTPFDISSVRATVGATGRIRIIVRFFDVLEWRTETRGSRYLSTAAPARRG